MLRFGGNKSNIFFLTQTAAFVILCFFVIFVHHITALTCIFPRSLSTHLKPYYTKRLLVKTYCNLDKFERDDSFNGLNPFEKRSSFGGGSTSGTYSLRQVRLKQLMSDLMSVSHSEDEMKGVLQQNEKFLMEQFDDLDSFLEADSIFNSTMNRSQRFDQYKVVMGERIAKAKTDSVKKILQCMTKFVLDHDERLSGNTINVVEI